MLSGFLITLFLILVIAGIALYRTLFAMPEKQRDYDFNPDHERQRAAHYPPPFPNGWFNLCPAEAVQKGEMIEVEAFGQRLAVFRGQNGKMGVMDIYCPHLKANLADGKVKGNHLACPFHGWKFSANGKCQSIPYADGVPQTDKVNTRAWTVKEDWGLILVWHHSENAPPSWQTDGYLDDLKDNKFHGMTRDILRMHLQDFAENGADYAHFSFVHDLLALPFANRFVHIRHETNIEFGDGEEKHLAWFSDTTQLVRNKDGSLIKNAKGGANVTYYGPGFLVFRFNTRFGNPVIVKTFTPLGELKGRMDDYIYAPKGMNRLAVKFLVREATVQFYDDIAVWERQAINSSPIAPGCPMFPISSLSLLWLWAFPMMRRPKRSLDGQMPHCKLN